MTCCFTGHRALPPEEIPAIKKRLEDAVADVIGRGADTFLAGGALGFDTLAAQTVLAMRAQHPQTRLILVLPCRDQAKFWGPADREAYEWVKAGADRVIYTAQTYRRDCMHLRNRYLAEHSDCCICYLTQPAGGTRYTVAACRARGLPVLNLA
ncbi:SLOG family protein [Ligaoa zhengdingensis]|uniref:SLOG family protein n=1 Tax=Ligaoa zhengdingensis TaxID=2763658 RepID=UPI0031BA08A4